MKLAITILIIVLALIVLGRTREAARRRSRELDYPARGQGTDADVERFVAAGRKMTAIKLYREIYNVDLKEAKEAVDRMAERRDGRG